MIYFKVKRDSEFYVKANETEIMKNKWFCNLKNLYSAVGLPVLEQIVMSPDLHYPDKPPSKLREQFRKNIQDGCYIAKVNSPINKQWRKLCAEYGLTFVTSLGSMVQRELFKTPYALGSKLNTIVRIGDDYYLEGERELPEADFLEQVSETDYLEARLKVAKNIA